MSVHFGYVIPCDAQEKNQLSELHLHGCRKVGQVIFFWCSSATVGRCLLGEKRSRGKPCVFLHIRI